MGEGGEDPLSLQRGEGEIEPLSPIGGEGRVRGSAVHLADEGLEAQVVESVRTCEHQRSRGWFCRPPGRTAERGEADAG
jgi:hypothetical protein